MFHVANVRHSYELAKQSTQFFHFSIVKFFDIIILLNHLTDSVLTQPISYYFILFMPNVSNMLLNLMC